MPRPTPQRCSPARATVRGGFTMIELLMVIVIIAILLALLLPAINGALKSAKKAAVSSEISQLAQALANFKSRYGDYPPSRFLAVENGNYAQFLGSTNPLSAVTLPDPYSPGDGDITLGQLAQRSVAAIRKFWPRVNTSTGVTTNTLVYDFNGNNNPDGAYILHGHECLVFFLGGVPSQDGTGNFAMTGFDKSPTNPFTNLVTSSNRQPPLFEFNPGRLFADPGSPTGVPGYYDSLGNAQPLPGGVATTLNFYAYFSAYGNGGYDPNDVNFFNETDVSGTNGPIGLSYLTAFPLYKPLNNCSSYAPNPYTSTLTDTAPVAFQSPQSFQIISSGIDGLYGVGGQYISSTSSSATNQLPLDVNNMFWGPTSGKTLSPETDQTIRKREQDNLTNFKPGSLE